jgi:hypothetical protein
MTSIKQIVEFIRYEGIGSADVELFAIFDSPREHVETLKSLLIDGAILQVVDCDSVRAVYRGVTQEKLLKLMDEGWSFDGG